VRREGRMNWNSVRNRIRNWTVRNGPSSPATLTEVPIATNEWDTEENRDPNLVFFEMDTSGTGHDTLYIQNDSPSHNLSVYSDVSISPGPTVFPALFTTASGSVSMIPSAPSDGDMWYNGTRIQSATSLNITQPENYDDVALADDIRSPFTIRVNTELFNIDIENDRIILRRISNDESNDNGEHVESPGDSLQRSEDMLQRWNTEQNTQG